jgi:RNA polymerase sigma-70 factor (ECF subfamily)
MDSSSDDITELLAQLRGGSPDAEAKLIPLIYQQLHGLAAHYLRGERPDHTLQPTALVNEAYVRLAVQRPAHWHDRAHFFGVAARLMRQILVDNARIRHAEKHGASFRAVPLEEFSAVGQERPRDIIALDDALKSLAKIDPRQSRIVELIFFGGLSLEETAEVLHISSSTVKRDWRVARAWLHGELSKEALK